MEIPLMVVAAAVAATWLCKILRIYLLNRILLLLVRVEIIKVTVVLHHLIHYCQQMEAARETLIFQTVALAVAAERQVQAQVGEETVNTVVAVAVITDITETKVKEAMEAMGALMAAAVAAVAVDMVVQDETVRLRAAMVMEECQVVAAVAIQLRDKTQPRYKEEMVVMAWIHAEWAWNLKGRGSVVLASNTLNTEAQVAAAVATAVMVEVLKQVVVEVLVVVAMAAMAETMTQVDKVALVVAAVMAAMEATVVILITQAVDQVAAEDMV